MSKKTEFQNKLLSTVISGNDPQVKEKYLDMISHARRIVPKRLFRYRSCDERSLDALLNDRMYFGTPARFNDPFDSVVDFDSQGRRKMFAGVTKEQLVQGTEYFLKNGLPSQLSIHPNTGNLATMMRESLLSNEGEAEAFSKFMAEVSGGVIAQITSLADSNADELEKIYQQVISETFVGCFTETVDSMLMWSHYADWHKGFTLEYDLHNLQSPCVGCQAPCGSSWDYAVYPVIYRKDRFNAMEAIPERVLYSIAKNHGVPVTFQTHDVFFFVKANIVKSLKWKYEREWRLIFACTNPKTNYLPLKPKAIYLGHKISENAIADAEAKITEYAKRNGIKLYQMKLNMDNPKFQLDRVEV
ncbi:MAG: DUF2971 domain-containing protein [Firmicutes bacterium]|nr:DUF2971 domain-containing protein [Bacillota bacterium]